MMVVVPGATAVATPAELPIVATPLFDDAHIAAPVTFCLWPSE